MLTVVPDGCPGHDDGRAAAPSLIDEIVREGARRMLAEVLRAEVDAYIAAAVAERDANGRRLVVRNGYNKPREVLTSAGAVEVTAPRVNDKRVDPVTGERKRFSSAISPPWSRKTPKIAAAVPAWPVIRRLRARPRPVPRLLRGLVTGGDHPAHRAVESRAARLRAAGPVWRRLRLPVGRRDPCEHPAGGAPWPLKSAGLGMPPRRGPRVG